MLVLDAQPVAVLVPTTLIVLVIVVVPEFTPVILTVVVVGPLLQLYVFAPVAVNVALDAEQTVPEGAGVTVTVGNWFTVNVTLAAVGLTQLRLFVPITL